MVLPASKAAGLGGSMRSARSTTPTRFPGMRRARSSAANNSKTPVMRCLSRPGGANGSFTSSIFGQHALTALYGSEQMLVGGIYSLQVSFDETSLTGDNGLVWRNELSFRFACGEPVAVDLPAALSRLRLRGRTRYGKSSRARPKARFLAGR